MTTTSASTAPSARVPRPGVVAVGVVMAVWCLGFAAVNVGFELGDRFADGRYADYTVGLGIANWLVTGLKVVGAGLALLAVTRRPRLVSPALVSAGLWGAFATLAVYAVGSVAQGVALRAGLTGSPDQVGLPELGYVLFFLAAAAGYGVLAVSHHRRYGSRKRPVVLGVLLAPVVLGTVLLALPALLAALGLLPHP